MKGRRMGLLLGGGVVCLLGVVGVVAAALFALAGADLGCGTGATALAATGPEPTRTAVREIPPRWLAMFREAGSAIDISWPFLASIGYQECGFGTGDCYVVNPSGCAGPMEMAYVRGSACSPDPSVPTIWERFKTDGDGDGKTEIYDDADSIFTAAKVLRAYGAPEVGGSFGAYHEAACNYYGACGDSSADYANEVMARAVGYGFGGPAEEKTAPEDEHAEGGAGKGKPGAAGPAKGGISPSRGERGPAKGLSPAGAGGQVCGAGSAGGALPSGKGAIGPVHRATSPAHLAPLPSPPAVSPAIECDARIIPDVVYLTRRFGLTVTACYGIHSTSGEHPLGAAIDAVPEDGDWDRTMQTALAIGWNPSCAASGVAPECATPPFRFIGYNGYPDHGDPEHCVPCAGGPHLHISWNTSASLGEPQNAPRYTYFAAEWIEVFEPGAPEDEGTSGEEADEGVGPDRPKGDRHRSGRRQAQRKSGAGS